MVKDFVGFGALGEALTMLDASSYKRVFIVATPSSWKRFNAKGKQPFFPSRECVFFSDFSSNPDFSDIEKGTELYKEFKPDLIVAIGGGSPIDVAKVIKALAHTKESFDRNRPETIKPSREGPPLTAITTTSGSGAEATRFAVFYVGDAKQSLADPSLRPEIAVVDPELAYDMPPRLTAQAGFDALSQAVESYWSSFANEESRNYAAAAIKYILPNIYNAVHEPAPDNRYNMANGSYLAGKAINITKTTIPHALAYHLTKRYGVAHGHAVALTVPAFILINSLPDAKVITPAGPEANNQAMQNVIEMLGQNSPEDAADFWRNLMKHCGLEATLAEVGVKTDDQVRTLIGTINPTRLGNNPVAVDNELLFRYLRQ